MLYTFLAPYLKFTSGRTFFIALYSLLTIVGSVPKRLETFTLFRSSVLLPTYHRFIPFSHYRSIRLYSTPPNMAALDRSAFDTEITFLALKVKPNQCSHYLTAWKNFLFKRPKMKSIYNTADNEYRLVVLNESFQDPSLTFAPEPLREEHLTQGHGIERYTMKFGYDHLTVEEVLRKLLPPHITEIPSSFEQAGHIAHMNLREDVLPYKNIIGQVIVDKNPAIRTVVNKIGQIETEFRTFPLEVLAGDVDMVVTLKESNATFIFNFADVYWNSRLQMEHNRVISMVKDRVSVYHQNHSQDKKVWIVADMMGGVGPFAVPLAQAALQTHTLQQLHRLQSAGVATTTSANNDKNILKKGNITPGMMIHANDLNPASYKYLVINQDKNRVESSLVPYNLDGRVFLRDLVGRQGLWPDEAIMNLPQNATDFLDVFIGLGHLYASVTSSSSLPMRKLRIHVYAFSTHPDDPIGDIVHRSAGVLRCRPEEITSKLYHEDGRIDEESGCLGHVVRDVAPKKVMVCLSFYLPYSVMYATLPSSTATASASEKLEVSEEKICGKRSADHL